MEKYGQRIYIFLKLRTLKVSDSNFRGFLLSEIIMRNAELNSVF